MSDDSRVEENRRSICRRETVSESLRERRRPDHALSDNNFEWSTFHRHLWLRIVTSKIHSRSIPRVNWASAALPALAPGFSSLLAGRTLSSSLFLSRGGEGEAVVAANVAVSQIPDGKCMYPVVQSCC